jgi:membrane-bound lytic murein transglycosylase F
MPNQTLRVLTLQRPLSFGVGGNQQGGIDFDLTNEFASTFGLDVSFKVFANEEDLFNALRNGEGDVAAARLRVPSNMSSLNYGPAYDETTLSLFCRRTSKIKDAQSLDNQRIIVPYRDRKNPIFFRIEKLISGVQIVHSNSSYSRNLLTEVAHKNADCAITETLEGIIALREFTSLELVETFSPSYSIHWLVSEKDSELLKAINYWHQSAVRNGVIEQVERRYKDHIAEVNYKDLRLFYRKIRDELPKHIKTFKAAAKESNLPWQLVAAVGFQESHWNESAESFTGVKGLMQLTTLTATHLGVEDREDSEQSIFGGAKYIRSLLNQVPDSVHPRDRLAIALAAYNIGPNHLKDAQKLAAEDGFNSWSWGHLQKTLPLLADEDIAADLEFGPARGEEPVNFVRRVLNYYEVLKIYFPKN